MARADPNVATPGPFRAYEGYGTLHGLSEVIDHREPLREQLDGTLALAHFDHRDSAEIDERRLNRHAQDLIDKPASLFTGKMRLLAQQHYSSESSVAFPFESSWATSHGLFVTGAGVPWVIEVSNAVGVKAWPLQVVPGFVNAGAPTDRSNFSFRPRLGMVGAAPPVTLLAGPLGIGGAPWANEGWAFNWSGTAAVIVTRTENNGYPWTALRRIDITLNGAGEPASAALTSVESDYCWQPAISPLRPRSRFKAPLAGELDEIVSVDLNGGKNTIPAARSDGPVYAFYRGDTLEVVRCHQSESSGGTVTKPEPPEGETGEWGTMLEASNVQCYSSSALGIVTGTTRSGSLTSRTRAGSGQGFFPGGASNPNLPVGVLGTAYGLIDKHATAANIVDGYFDLVVIPVRDREAVYHLRQHERTESHDGATVAMVGWFIEGRSVDQTTALGWHIGLAGDNNAAADHLTVLYNIPATNARHSVGAAAPRVMTTQAPKPGEYVDVTRNFYSGSLNAAMQDHVQREEAAAPAFTYRDLGPTGTTTGDPQRGDHTAQHSYDRTLDGTNYFAPQVHTVIQVPDVWTGLQTLNQPDVSAQPAQPETTDADVQARLTGSVVDETLTVTLAQVDNWTRPALVNSPQTWLVCQDAADSAHALYSIQPFPEGGAFGATLDGAAEYVPATIVSPVLSWVGRP